MEKIKIWITKLIEFIKSFLKKKNVKDIEIKFEETLKEEIKRLTYTKRTDK